MGEGLISDLLIRLATDDDWPGLWPIIEAVTRAGDSYAYPLDMPESVARALWTPPPPGGVLVAVENGEIIGVAKVVPNRPGPGAHVANGSFMVAPHARGRGVARRLGEAALGYAREAGFRSMQFNAVVATNEVAVGLWTSLGFEILCTVPEAFDHPDHGLVGLHIMYRKL